MEITLTMLVVVAVIALLCQYMSVSMGVGYGTALTPVLLMMGFSPLQIVPAVLVSQLIGGLIGVLAHHRAGNITLDFRQDDKPVRKRLRALGYLPRSDDSKVILILAACGVLGVLVGVLTTISIPKVVVETYIGVMVLGIGLAVLFRRSRSSAFSWKGLVALGLVAAFNKGVSGGGYVPLVTGGQIISGRDTKSSVGSTTMSVALVCMVGFLGYMLIEGDIYWALAVATITGSVMAAPFATMTVRKVGTTKLKVGIGIATILLGILTLAKTFVS